jgi:hypothetical protein
VLFGRPNNALDLFQGFLLPKLKAKRIRENIEMTRKLSYCSVMETILGAWLWNFCYTLGWGKQSYVTF